MIEIVLNNNEKKQVVNSTFIEQELRNNKNFEYVKDISDTIKEKGVLIFDCKLGNSIFSLDEMDEEVFEEFGIPSDYFEFLMEDIYVFIKSIVEDITHDIKEYYHFDNIKSNFEIYDLNEDFTDIKFVLSISFKKIARRELISLSKIIGKRQLQGSSKYFH